VKASAYGPGEHPRARSATVSAVFRQYRLGADQGVPLSALQPTEVRVHGQMLRDVSFGGATLSLGGREFATGLVTHPEATPDGRAEVVYALDGRLSKAQRFSAWVGVDDSAGNAGSCQFAVEVRRGKAWERVFESEILRGGEPPVEVDVTIRGAERLRLIATDGGDNINSDHAAWGGAVLR